MHVKKTCEIRAVTRYIGFQSYLKICAVKLFRQELRYTQICNTMIKALSRRVVSSQAVLFKLIGSTNTGFVITYYICKKLMLECSSVILLDHGQCKCSLSF